VHFRPATFIVWAALVREVCCHGHYLQMVEDTTVLSLKHLRFEKKGPSEAALSCVVSFGDLFKRVASFPTKLTPEWLCCFGRRSYIRRATRNVVFD
jgi:hypothetical protein